MRGSYITRSTNTEGFPEPLTPVEKKLVFLWVPIFIKRVMSVRVMDLFVPSYTETVPSSSHRVSLFHIHIYLFQWRSLPNGVTSTTDVFWFQESHLSVLSFWYLFDLTRPRFRLTDFHRRSFLPNLLPLDTTGSPTNLREGVPSRFE